MPVFGNRDVALQHAALDFNRTARRIEDAAEFDQETVAHYLEDAPAMLGYGGIEELAAMEAKRAERPFLIGLHEPAVANDVRRQDGSQPRLDLLLGHACPHNRRGSMLLDPETDGQHYGESRSEFGQGHARMFREIADIPGYGVTAESLFRR